MQNIDFDITKPLDIVLLGRIAIDFNPMDYYKPLSESGTFKKYLGGSPANIAVGMARLGRKVGFLGKVSDDRFGEFVTSYFEREGIDISYVTRCRNGECLGLTFTEILSPEESSILMYREGAADLQLHPADIDREYIAKAKMLLVSGTALSHSPSREAALKAVLLAQRCGVPVVLDADYRPYSWRNDDEVAVYTALAAEKAEIILGSRDEFDRMERFTGLDGTDEASSAYWLGKQAKIVIIKHGKHGSSAYTNESRYTVKPFPVDALKGFGGGDGYASAFLHGILSQWDIMDALEFASASAAILVASHACSKDMPDEEAVRKFIAQKKVQCGDRVTRN